MSTIRGQIKKNNMSEAVEILKEGRCDCDKCKPKATEMKRAGEKCLACENNKSCPCACWQCKSPTPDWEVNILKWSEEFADSIDHYFPSVRLDELIATIRTTVDEAYKSGYEKGADEEAERQNYQVLEREKFARIAGEEAGKKKERMTQVSVLDEIIAKYKADREYTAKKILKKVVVSGTFESGPNFDEGYNQALRLAANIVRGKEE